MKAVIVTLAMLLVAMVIGCRDDSSMNPLANQELASSVLAKPIPYNDIILPLEGILNDPEYHGTRISGRVVAQLEGNGRLCDLTLCINAELWAPSGDERWIVTGSCFDLIKLPAEGGKVSFCKDYAIKGRSNRVQLCLDFFVLWKPGINFRSVYLEGMEIEVVKRLPGPEPNNW